MTDGIFDRMRTYFGADQPDEHPTVDDRGRLYECGNCETIFIRVEERPCPDCGHVMEHIPNERDLGLH